MHLVVDLCKWASRIRPRAGKMPAKMASPVTSLSASDLLQMGCRMPAEWEKHAGCWMGWPEREDNWRMGATPAQQAFTHVATAISQFEPVTVCTSSAQFVVQDGTGTGRNDSTANPEDGPQRGAMAGPVIGVHWKHNGYGKPYYAHDKDELIGWKVCELERLPRVHSDMVLEGGSIHVDGEGTLLTTEECLLNPNRNPHLSKQQLEANLRAALGVTTIIWLPEGLYGDEDTNGHIDNLACFARPGVVLLSWTDDPGHPQHQRSVRALEVLQRSVDATGRKLQVIKLPLPPLMHRTKEEVASLAGFEGTWLPGRQAGEVLAASYANFYIANGGIVMPAFGVGEDAAAQAVLQAVFPDRRVVAIAGSREILLGGGNIHCITCQQPAAPAQQSAE